jgi:hypothetical protein
MNVAIAFGRLGLVDSAHMSKYLVDQVTKAWCLSIRILKSTEEKASAFR